ncbi:MAG TPA: hypothetical protein VG295_03995 [Solirubrobacteraceae bacterium]|nr:hypothetical protein [Solirubrobacteraceae bacterium]
MGASASGPQPGSGAKVELFGHLGYVSPSGVAGVFVGCFGSSPCTGSVTIKQAGRTIAHRASETVAPDNGGIAHVRLIPSARRAIAHGRLSVTVTVADRDGHRASRPEELVPFDTPAAIAGVERAFTAAVPAGIKIFGHTGFVNAGGTTGVFLGCFAVSQCSGTMTLTAAGMVVGGRSRVYVFPNDGSLAYVTLRANGRHLLAKHHRLTVTVTVTSAGGARALGRVTLVPYFGDIDDYALVTSPARVGASSTTTFDLALTNASSPGLNLGSAKLDPPAGFKLLTASLPAGVPGRLSVAGNVIALRGLRLSAGASVHLKVTAVAPTRCRGSSAKWASASWEGESFNVQALKLDNSRSTAILAVNAPCTVHFMTQPANTSVGQHITGTAYDPSGKPVSIAVVDGAGKVVTSSRASVTVGLGANPGKATLGGTTTVRAVHGVATFHDLTVSKASVGYTLTASGSRLHRAATSRSFDASSTSTMCVQDGGCQTNLTSGASNFLVIANPDPSRANSGTLSESANVGKPLQCSGYTQEDPNSWEFEMSSANRSKTIVSTLKQFILPLQGTLNAILELTQVCFGSTSDFVTSSGTLAPAATLPDGTAGFVGLLPNCPSSGGPCVVARQGPLDLNNNIGFDIVVTVSVPEGLSGDPWMRT